MKTPLVAFVPFLVLVIGQGKALAQPADVPVTLEWSAPAECPSHDQVLARVGAFLHGSTATPVGTKARASVSRRGSGWHIDMAIQTADGGGMRSFDADSCESVANTAAFVLALAVDPAHPPTMADPALPTPFPDHAGTPAGPAASVGTIPPAPAAPVPTPPAPSAESPARPAAASESAVARGLRRGPIFPWAVGASAIVDDGSLPSPAFGAELAFAWRPSPWRFEVDASILSSQSVAVPALPGTSADFSLLGGGARGCFTASAWRFELGPCLGAEVDRVNAAGHGLPTTFSGSATTFEAAALALGTLSIPPVAIRFGAEALLPFARPDFVVLQPSNQPALFVHHSAAVEGRSMVGLELRFP
jgi:hypothetical protein